jgi:hypothetical protein
MDRRDKVFIAMIRRIQQKLGMEYDYDYDYIEWLFSNEMLDVLKYIEDRSANDE